MIKYAWIIILWFGIWKTILLQAPGRATSPFHVPPTGLRGWRKMGFRRAQQMKVFVVLYFWCCSFCCFSMFIVVLFSSLSWFWCFLLKLSKPPRAIKYVLSDVQGVFVKGTGESKLENLPQLWTKTVDAVACKYETWRICGLNPIAIQHIPCWLLNSSSIWAYGLCSSHQCQFGIKPLDGKGQETRATQKT